MSPRWGLRIFRSPVFYKHTAPLGLLVGQDARLTGMGVDNGTQSVPTTLLTTDPSPTIFVRVGTVLLSDRFDVPFRFGVPML